MQDSSGSGPVQVQRQLDLAEDDDFSRVLSLSVKVCKYSFLFIFYTFLDYLPYWPLVLVNLDQTAEQEKTMREQGVKLSQVYDLVTEDEKTTSSTRKVCTLSYWFCLPLTTPGFTDIVSYIRIISSNKRHSLGSVWKLVRS